MYYNSLDEIFEKERRNLATEDASTSEWKARTYLENIVRYHLSGKPDLTGQPITIEDVNRAYSNWKIFAEQFDALNLTLDKK